MKALTSVELAYMAGYFDADGSITGYNDKRQGPILYVLVGSADQNILESFKGAFGGWITQDVKAGQRRKSTPIVARRNAYRWQSKGRIGARALRALLPYLRLKKSRAELYLEMRGLKGHQYSHGVPEEVMQRRHEILDEIRALNHGKYSATRVMT